MRKAFLIPLLAVAVSLACAAFALGAASLPRLDLGAPSARSGQAVTVPVVFAAKGAAITSLSIDIGFDPAAVSVALDPSAPKRTLAAQPGPAAQAAGKMLIQGLPKPGLLRLGWFDASKGAVIGDGVVAYVTFQVKPGARLVLTNKPAASDAKGQELVIGGTGLDVN